MLCHSIILVAYKEPRNILKQAHEVFKGYKTYLALNYADKETIKIAREVCPDFEILISDKECHLKAANVNYAIDFVDEEIVGLFDIDNKPTKTYIDNVVNHLKTHDIGVCVGREEITERNTLAERLAYMEQQQYLDTIEYACVRETGGYLPLPGAGYFMYTADLKRIRMSENTITEDSDLSIRLVKEGIKGAIIKDKMELGTPRTLKGYINQRVRWTKGQMQLLWKNHKDTKEVNYVMWVIYNFLIFCPLLGLIRITKYSALLILLYLNPILGIILTACALFTDLEDKYWMIVKTQGLCGRKLAYPTIISEVLYIYIFIKSLYEYKFKPLYWYLTEK